MRESGLAMILTKPISLQLDTRNAIKQFNALVDNLKAETNSVMVSSLVDVGGRVIYCQNCAYILCTPWVKDIIFLLQAKKNFSDTHGSCTILQLARLTGPTKECAARWREFFDENSILQLL